jgi:hypothetical protein
MTQTGSGRQQVVMRDANLPCDLVGGFETDTVNALSKLFKNVPILKEL